jgi:hypothetical protein
MPSGQVRKGRGWPPKAISATERVKVSIRATPNRNGILPERVYGEPTGHARSPRAYELGVCPGSRLEEVPYARRKGPGGTSAVPHANR